MELQGHKGLNNPKSRLSSLLTKREKLQHELRSIEKQVYELETSYLQETTTFGNALKGFDGFLSSSSKNMNNLKKSRKFQLEDRVFSLSSVTSPAMLPVEEGTDGKPDVVHSRNRGGVGTTAQGKPKKGRTGHRDMKKTRLSSDLDPDDDEDLI